MPKKPKNASKARLKESDPEFHDYCHKHLLYSPADGYLYRNQLWFERKTVPCPWYLIGKPDRYGNLDAKFNRMTLCVHRVCYFLGTGAFPNDSLEHVNGIRLDNRLSNLREFNSRASDNNLLKYDDEGIAFDPVRQEWHATWRGEHVGWYKDCGDAIMGQQRVFVTHWRAYRAEQNRKALNAFYRIAYGQVSLAEVNEELIGKVSIENGVIV
jgi:hypothetical protein